MPRNFPMESPTDSKKELFMSINDSDEENEDLEDDTYVFQEDTDDDDEEEEDEEDDEEESPERSIGDSDEDEPENPNIFERSAEHLHLQTSLKPPFWYGNEDQDQAGPIFSAYADRLKLALCNHSRIREPKLFVGCIKRQAVANCGSTQWTTLDEVTVFTREKVAFGLPMPKSFTRMLLTVWHAEDGVPVRQHSVKSSVCRRYWLARVQGTPSFLYALPDAQDPRDQLFKYHASEEDEPVGYAPLSNRVTFAPWVPAAWRLTNLEKDEGELFCGECDAECSANVTTPR